MILTYGWDDLEDIWKRRAEKLLDEEQIDELIQCRAAEQLKPAQTSMAQISIFAEDTSSSALEDERYSA